MYFLFENEKINISTGLDKQALRRFLWAAQIVTRLHFQLSVYSVSVYKKQVYKCAENQFKVQVFKKPVYGASVQKTSLKYKCSGNQFIVQVNRKPV